MKAFDEEFEVEVSIEYRGGVKRIQVTGVRAIEAARKIEKYLSFVREEMIQQAQAETLYKTVNKI